MITICTGCETRYRLDDAKVPRRVIRVRCPGCAAVFELDGTQAVQPEPVAPAARQDTTGPSGPIGVAASPPPPASRPPATPPPPATPEKAVPEVAAADPAPVRSGNTATPAPAKPSGAKVATPEPAQPVASLAVEEPPAEPTRRRSRDKARMLARAIVSDILVYNREQRDKALAEGNMLEALGAEIKKSWELYKEKVGEEVANSTNHFRDALNEILADGERIF
jgi:predicted Zn finger-like uncharacterized protein